MSDVGYARTFTARNDMSTLSEPLNQGSVVALVVDRIKEALLKREIKPGDFLPSEPVLAKNLGVSKSTVREAVKMLQAFGVVEIKRGQGTVICTTPSEALINPLVFQMLIEGRQNEHVIDMRQLLEPIYTIAAMERATKEDIEAIQSTIDHFETVIKAGNPQAEDDIAFHLAILKATHNPYLIRIGETILQLFEASISWSMRNIPETALRDHKMIFAAFLEKDEDKLYRAVIESFEGWKKSLSEF